MHPNPTLKRFGLVAALGAVLAPSGCSGTAPSNPIGAPDISKIVVFYPDPVDDLVRGRGDVGSMPPGATHFVVSALPTGTRTILPLETNGSFNFGLFAVSDDILEIAAARDGSGTGRGEPVYVRVPLGFPPREPYICCQPAGTCQSQHEAMQGAPCPDRNSGARVTPCTSVAQCGPLIGEILPIEKERMRVTSPDKDGKITVSGATSSHGALITLQNRGQRGIGGRDPGIHLGQITDANGNFRFAGVNARGDDELILQLRDLNDKRSPPLPLMVPAAEFERLDILGAYPFQPLQNGAVGTVAVRLFPQGVDGHGICPKSETNPILCLSGGLTHDMITIDEARFGCGDPVHRPPATPLSTTLASNRGTEGDPQSGRQRLVLIVDMSEAALKSDPAPPRRLAAAAQFVRSLRREDQLGIITYGGDPTRSVNVAVPIGGSDDSWRAQLSALSDLGNAQARGPSTIFQAITRAAALLDEQRSTVPGNIIVIAAGDATGTRDQASAAYSEALDKVAPRRDRSSLGYGVYVIGVGLRDRAPACQTATMPMPDQYCNVQFVKDIAGFAARGTFTNVASPLELGDALGDAVGALSGAYVLLYDMMIPQCVGKCAQLSLSVTANLPGPNGPQVKTSTYQGPLEVRGSSQSNCN